MPSSSERRVFLSPKLEVGETYRYTFKAEFARNGKRVEVSRVVPIKAGAEVTVVLFDEAVATR